MMFPFKKSEDPGAAELWAHVSSTPERMDGVCAAVDRLARISERVAAQLFHAGALAVLMRLAATRSEHAQRQAGAGGTIFVVNDFEAEWVAPFTRAVPRVRCAVPCAVSTCCGCCITAPVKHSMRVRCPGAQASLQCSPCCPYPRPPLGKRLAEMHHLAVELGPCSLCADLQSGCNAPLCSATPPHPATSLMPAPSCASSWRPGPRTKGPRKPCAPPASQRSSCSRCRAWRPSHCARRTTLRPAAWRRCGWRTLRRCAGAGTLGACRAHIGRVADENQGGLKECEHLYVPVHRPVQV